MGSKVLNMISSFNSSNIVRCKLNQTCPNLHFENYKMLVEEHLKKWINVPDSWIGKLNTVKIPVLPVLIFRFKGISIKIPAGKKKSQQESFCRYKKDYSKVYVCGNKKKLH